MSRVMRKRAKVEFKMLILIAGPYRSGTNDDPLKMAANLKVLEAPSYALFQAGHVPMIGEWVALPVWHAAGGARVGDELYEESSIQLLIGCWPWPKVYCVCPAHPKVRTMMSGSRANAESQSGSI